MENDKFYYWSLKTRPEVYPGIFFMKPIKEKYIIGFMDSHDANTQDEEGNLIPFVFDTRQEAEEEIQYDIAAIAEAIKKGDMQESSRAERDDYDIAYCDMDESGNVEVYDNDSRIIEKFNVRDKWNQTINQQKQ